MQYWGLTLILIASSAICMWSCEDSITDDATENFPAEISNRQIIYRTSDNVGVQFENEDVFGKARIMSNTYSKDKGYWIIDFDTVVTVIGREAFKDCSNLTHIGIPKSVRSVGEKAFARCADLRSVIFHGQVDSIKFWTFGYCDNLTRFVIPESVKVIEQFAFGYCSRLNNVVIPQSVNSIDLSAFEGCNSLTNMKVDEENRTYDSRNDCNAIVHTRTNTLIAGCKTSVIPQSVTGIGVAAFSGCETLTKIDIPTSVTSIGGYAFHKCTNLRKVIIPNSVTNIYNHAFFGCSNLTDVKLPSSIKVIREGTFKDCVSLATVVIPASVERIIDAPFEGCSNLVNITVVRGNEIYDSRDRCNAIVETASNTLIAGCKATVIPTSVTEIGAVAFLNCYGLTSITLPNSIAEIGSKAFYGCKNLKEVHCKAAIPPHTSMFSAIFYETPNPTIYVSPFVIELYKEHYFWGNLNLQPENIQ